MTSWTDYINEINTDYQEDSPTFSGINVGTGMVLNGNLRQSNGEIQTTGLKLDSVSLSTVQTSAESFVDNDTSIMTSAAIQDKIEAYGYTTATGDITGVTAGSGLSGGGTSGGVSLAVADLAVSHFAGATIQTGSESFADNDTTLMTSAAVQDKITSYGYITGVTNIAGNAATATALQTARNIGGVSFDGTGNIDLAGVNSAGNQDTSGNAATATALETARTIGGVSFNGTANINLAGVNATGNQDTSGNAATATALATARNIGGVSFDGTGNIDLAGVNTAGNQNTSGNAATATALATARAINGVDFDGTGDITVTADANTLSGTTLKSSVVNSSLTSVGTLSSLATGAITLNGTAITATAAELNMLDGASTAWTSFTPVWESGVTDNGSASITANFLRFGDLCFWEMLFVAASDTTYHASDVFRMQLIPSGLPTPTAGPTYSSFGGGWVRPTGSTIYPVQVVEVNNDIILYLNNHSSGNYSTATSVKKTTPVAWNTSGIMYMSAWYRTA